MRILGMLCWLILLVPLAQAKSPLMGVESQTGISRTVIFPKQWTLQKIQQWFSLGVQKHLFKEDRSFFEEYSAELAPLSTLGVNKNICLIANRLGHLLYSDSYSKNTYKAFSSPSSALFLIPIGLDVVLSPKEFQHYQNQVVEFCSALVALGGADLSPQLYHQKNHGSHPGLMRVDQAEIKLIRRYLKKGQGPFYGICRGHQAYAVAAGGDLVQDLSLLGESVSQHRSQYRAMAFGFQTEIESSVWHWIQLTDENNALFQAVHQKNFFVNSRHHQAVKGVPKNARVIARTENQKIIEALEARDDQGRVRVLTTQFHPEDMNTLEGNQILNWMLKQVSLF